MWVRGLKQQLKAESAQRIAVASYVGAWIETWYREPEHNPYQVASYVGAWIETSLQQECGAAEASHPMWVRGLKLDTNLHTLASESRILCGCVD